MSLMDGMETDGFTGKFFHKLIISKKDEKPSNVIPTFEQNLEQLHLCEASQLLIEKEDHLFRDKTDAKALKQHEETIEKLAADRSKLKDLVLHTLLQSLSLRPEEVNTDTLMSAIKAVYQEEEQDQLWSHRGRTPPAWRPCGWKKLHDSMLRSLVEGRMDNILTPSADQVDQSFIQEDVHNMAKQLIADLMWVVQGIKSCYPPQMDICNFYARMYHQTFSTRLTRKITDASLEDKDCTFVLRWVNEYYPEIFKKPQLAGHIDTEGLEKLLPKELLEPLEEQYLSKRQSELMTYIYQILEEAENRWNNGDEAKKEDGCYISPVAYDCIQVINGMVTGAEKVVGDRHKAQSLTRELNVFMQRFRDFQDNIIRQNSANSKAYVKANLGCVEQFSDVLTKNRYLFPDDVQEDCLSVLTDMKQSAHTYLIKPVHEVLKPQYHKLGTDDWLKKPVFENLLFSIKAEIQDLKGSTESCHQELIGQFHQDVTVEYVRRLLKGKVKLKKTHQQHQACMVVKDNANSLHNIFSTMGSKEVWLKDILIQIAEVLTLQELPAIQMEVASLGSTFPDLSLKHVSALLKLKTNLSKADRKLVKETLSATLREIKVTGARPFFSKVQVQSALHSPARSMWSRLLSSLLSPPTPPTPQ
ncbi:tumor necrosis factor alpha-induced protein 2-like [Channa argus]|uniref:tumor necrosis factor alpha-induced protein 2-like n=1 Tax=Channa argus TaxID=215402 RepID=UPI0035210518